MTESFRSRRQGPYRGNSLAQVGQPGPGTLAISALGILSLPVFSSPLKFANYEPLAAGFLVWIALLSLGRPSQSGRVDDSRSILILFFVYEMLHTSFAVGILLNQPDLIVRSLAPLVFGILCYIGARYIVSNFGQEFIEHYSISAGKITLIYGMVELFAVMGHVPGFKEIAGFLFGNIHEGRIQLFTSEASWASKYLIFLLPFLIYSDLPRRRMWIAMWTVLFLLLFSLDGMLSISVGGGIFVLITAILKRRILPLAVTAATISIIVLTVVFLRHDIATTMLDMNLYFTNRIGHALNATNLSDSIMDVVSVDDSSYIRIFYPLAGFKMMFTNPFGYGLGSFPYVFDQFIPQDIISPTTHPEVTSDIYFNVANPLNLYSKLSGECGVLGLGIFLMFLFFRLRSAVRDFKVGNHLPLLACCLALGAMVQFGSFLYVPMWVALALPSSQRA